MWRNVNDLLLFHRVLAVLALALSLSLRHTHGVHSSVVQKKKKSCAAKKSCFSLFTNLNANNSRQISPHQLRYTVHFHLRSLWATFAMVNTPKIKLTWGANLFIPVLPSDSEHDSPTRTRTVVGYSISAVCFSLLHTNLTSHHITAQKQRRRSEESRKHTPNRSG